jgi:redox-sensitive bicupin YhaK (pirin superfamily)
MKEDKSVSVSQVVQAPAVSVGNDTVLRPFPHQGVEGLSPFILLDHLGPKIMPPGKGFNVPPHPHAGFSAVTYFLKGEGYHRDSLGNEQYIGPGDVNWMTAGKGIVHSEHSSPRFTEEGGEIELLQIWVNLPSEFKHIEPEFGAFSASEFPVVTIPNGTIKVIAGSYSGEHAPVRTYSDVIYHHVTIEPDSVSEMDLPKSANAMLYVIQGHVRIDKGDVAYEKGDCVWLTKGSRLDVSTLSEGASFLILGGEDLMEPVVPYGPFVMNDFRQIQIAAMRYETGEMGHLEPFEV